MCAYCVMQAAVVAAVSGFELVEMAMFVRKLDQSRSAAEVAWLAGIKAEAKRMFSRHA